MNLQLPPWLKISLLLSVFGFLKEFRPSEPFVFEFLTGAKWRNLTAEDVNQQVYPVGTYSYLALLVVVFLITDLCRYKPLIIVLAASGIVIWSMLLWTTSIVALQIMEVFYGLFAAAEVAYYTYTYAKVSRDHYPAVTSHARAAALIGRFSASLTAQLLISYKIMDFRQLNYITLGVMIFATIWAIFLPSVQQSVYFNQIPNTSLKTSQTYVDAFSLLWTHFKSSYSSFHVIKWSLWWSLATCGFIQVVNYIQPLWGIILSNGYTMKREDELAYDVWNGGVEAILTLLGAVGAIVAGALKIDWSSKGELALAICSLIGGGVLFMSAVTKNIWVCYVGYIVFCVLYQFMITVATSEVAKELSEDSYGLIFGLNTLLALVFQTILTVVFVSADGFAMDPREQYLVYGGYHCVLGALFFMIVIFKLLPKISSCCSKG